MMKANKKVMAALLAAMMTVSAGAAVVSAATPVDGIGSVGNTTTATSGWMHQKVGGKDYWSYKISKGVYAAGWKMIDGAWYFFAQIDANGNPVNTGLTHSSTVASSDYYAIVDKTADILCADGGTYTFRFGKDGKMLTGWYRVSNALDPVYGDSQNWEYYSPSTGAKQVGWIKEGANWYYMTNTTTRVEYKENGQSKMKTLPAGTLMMNGTYKFWDGENVGKTYTFAANGVLVNEGQGWIKEGENWYWVQENGSRFTGAKADSVTFTANSWNKINGKYYIFDENGVMQTGWVKALNSKGEAKWYYCTANGDCVLNNWVQMADGTWYLTNASGEMVTGWAVRGGKTYYLNEMNAAGNGTVMAGKPYGVMATGTVMIKGYKCTFDANGALVSINDQVVNPGTIPTL